MADYPVTTTAGSILEDSRGGLALNRGAGPCIPCAGLHRFRKSDGTVEDTWTDEYGLRNDIATEIPAGYDRLFPVGLTADQATKLWFSAVKFKIELTWAYDAYHAPYYYDPHGDHNVYLHATDIALGRYTGSCVREIDLNRQNFKAPTYGHLAYDLVETNDMPHLPDDPFYFISLACYDYLKCTTISTIDSTRQRGLIDCPIVYDAENYKPEIAFSLSPFPASYGWKGSREIFSWRVPEWPSIQLSNTYSPSASPSECVYDDSINVDYDVFGVAGTGLAYLRFAHVPYSSDATLPICYPESLQNSTKYTFPGWRAFYTNNGYSWATRIFFISNVSVTAKLTIS
jgi:hypothetical protein